MFVTTVNQDDELDGMRAIVLGFDLETPGNVFLEFENLSRLSVAPDDIIEYPKTTITRAEIEWLTKERDYKQTVIEKLSGHIEKVEAERDETQVASIWKGPGETPHRYSPDYMAQGDCQVCGHTREAHQSHLEAYGREKVPPAPAVPDDVAKLWQDTADNDDFCALFGLIPLRDTATGEAIMWQEKSGDFIDFAVALRDALETQADAVARLVKAVKNERHHKSAYDATPTDRRGYNGPKGQAYVLWCEARADVGTALEAIEASPCPAAGGAESV